MRIAIVPFPMLFQREAALQTQVREALRALQAQRHETGMDPTVLPCDAAPELAEDVDAIHVFSASGSNQRWIALAEAARVPLVLSPLLSPGWNADCADTGLRRAMERAAMLVALGKNEKRSLDAVFAPGRVRLLGTGVGAQQFAADGELFRQRTGMRGPFVLLAGPVAPQHQQHALARLLTAQGMPVVMLGEARGRDQAYLDHFLALPGVTCLGGLGHDPSLLGSAYAAASLLVLTSQGDQSVRVVLDALAAGTPVVLSAASPIDVPQRGAGLRHVLAGDTAARERAVRELLSAAPARDAVRALVRPLSWDRAALQLAGCYAAVAGQHAPLPA